MSTYASITAENLLQILWPDGGVVIDEHLRAILLRAPAQQISNGILLSQANEYRVSAQEKLIDYLLSGAANVLPEHPAQAIHSTLENLRLNLMELGENLEQLELRHNQLIAHSQARLIVLARNISNSDIIHHNMSDFVSAAKDMHNEFKDIGTEILNALIQVKNTLILVSDYRPTPVSMLNR